MMVRILDYIKLEIPNFVKNVEKCGFLKNIPPIMILGIVVTSLIIYTALILLSTTFEFLNKYV